MESGYEPIGHAVHVADPAPATDPDAHLTHAVADVARRTLLAVPTRHDVQIEEPSESLNVPSRQSEQPVAFLPPNFERAVPGTQNWSQNDAPIAAVHDPGGHSRQDVRPDTGAYEPGGHFIGCVAPGQYEPTEHTSQEYDAPENEPDPAGHGVQGPVVVPVGENVPFKQLETGAAPTRHDDCAESGYEPVGHAVHTAEPAAATEPVGHAMHTSADVARRALLA